MTAQRILFAAILFLVSRAPLWAEGATPLLRAEKVRNILRKYCVECHSGPKSPGGLQILDMQRLASVLTPNNPESSELLQLVECGSMPPGSRTKVPPDEVILLHDWIAGGAAAFSAESSEDYVLAQSLLDVRAASGTNRDVGRERYISFNHLLGSADADPELFREALTRTLNLLSWKDKIAKPTPIDGTGTIFRLKIEDFGWDEKLDPGSKTILYDLILLEYPHAVLPQKSAIYDELDREYLQIANMLRPVPYLRGDWLVSAAGQSPVYEDLLRLPVSLSGLEKRLGHANSKRDRAILAESDYMRGPRILERRAVPGSIFWRTFDLTGQKDAETVKADLAKEPTAGGEVLFSLPNSLPGFFVVASDGHRLQEVPSPLLKKDQVLRNGTACASCHAGGLKEVKGADPALEKLAGLVKTDNETFARSPMTLLDKPATRDSLAIVDRLYKDRSRANSVENVIPPLDGLTHPELLRSTPLKVEVGAYKVGEKKPTSVYYRGDKWYVEVKNTGEAAVWVELIYRGRSGNVLNILTDLPNKEESPKKLEKGEKMTFPGTDGFPIEDEKTGKIEPGKVTITVFVSDAPFAAGVKYSMNKKPREVLQLADYISDRFVHIFKDREGAAAFGRIEKRTCVIETREK